MDIFPDWLGQTGGAGTPYPVLVQGLDLVVEMEQLQLAVQDADVGLVVATDTPVLTVVPSDTVQVVATAEELELEVDGA
jgi:hypothetical protein